MTFCRALANCPSRVIGCTLFAVVAICGPLALADTTFPVPKTIIYPRDVIRDHMLEDRVVNSAQGRDDFFSDRNALVGKVARATLLAGQLVPKLGVETARLVSIGAQVKIVFSSDGITITAFGLAMQNGAVGDFVRVRNSESGLIVTGKVGVEGAILVGGDR